MAMQVFDSGLIGEGVLHMLAAAKQKLLTKDAILVPAAATVFCQPLQMRVGQASTVSSLSPKPFPLLPFVSAVPSLPFPLCLSLSAFPSLPFSLCLSLSIISIWSSLSCCYCQAMQMQVQVVPNKRQLDCTRTCTFLICSRNAMCGIRVMIQCTGLRIQHGAGQQLAVAP